MTCLEFLYPLVRTAFYSRGRMIQRIWGWRGITLVLHNVFEKQLTNNSSMSSMDSETSCVYTICLEGNNPKKYKRKGCIPD